MHCPLTYALSDTKYSIEGIKRLSKNLDSMNDLQFTNEELHKEAGKRALKMSIQGVQPKVSAVFASEDKTFQLITTGGLFILKPQHPLYEQLPENEDLSMYLAAMAGIETPLHGLIYTKDHKLVYFIKRFDRITVEKKLHTEDFAQLSGRCRDTKYDSSIEQVIKIVENFCTFPMIEKTKLYKRILFCFLTGNEDMHLKNFSLIVRDNKSELSPAYDFVNTTITMNATEETALPIDGKKSNLTYKNLVDYLGRSKLALSDKIIDNILHDFVHIKKDWDELLAKSFLTDLMKQEYRAIISSRSAVLKL